jgi:hypothetical protein
MAKKGCSRHSKPTGGLPRNPVPGLGNRDIRGGVKLGQPHQIRRGSQEDQVVSQKIGYSVAGVRRTKSEQTQKEVKKSKPNKKEHEAKIQLAQGTLPRSGARPIVKIYISVPGQRRFYARTMFDTGAAIPIIISIFINQHNLPTIN